MCVFSGNVAPGVSCGPAAVCSGTAVVLQASAVSHLPADVRLGRSLVSGLVRNRVYLVALVLVALAVLVLVALMFRGS